MAARFNVLLDRLPTEYQNYKINSDFRIGVQMLQALSDPELSRRERLLICFDLLFGGFDEKPDAETARAGVEWFLNDWYTDKAPKKQKQQENIGPDKKEEQPRRKAPDFDWDVDQWRIYAAFMSQYHIDLNNSNLHFWSFMALLRNLDECAFTNVIDLRNKKIKGNMSQEQKRVIKSAQYIYGLENPEDQETEYEREQREKIANDFLSRVKIKRVEN